MKSIFIDGSAGTTGLRIFERLAQRKDIFLMTLSDELRKDPARRKEMLNKADIAFLCLPDDAARESVGMVENPNTVIIDTSTAHRTEKDWAYGFAELSEKFENNIRMSNRISVPGCHASGFIALIYPLIENGILEKDAFLTCHSITGYSGGGKKMISEYQLLEDESYHSPRQYGLSQNHKHLKEMKAVTGIDSFPIFCPIVSNFYSGMLVTVPLFKKQLKSGFSADDIKAIYKSKYNSDMVRYFESIDENGFAAGNSLSGKDSMHITVSGNEERILLMAQYDNLGKGASGAAIECMNISMGTDKYTGLVI